jgi:hypothetical protein
MAARLWSDRFLLCAVHAVLVPLLVSCSRSKPPQTDTLATALPPAVCQASASWVTNPSQPAEVAPAETFCDFYQFSWQWFLSQVSLAANGERVFETNRLVDLNPSTVTNQCAQPALSGRAAAARLLAPRDLKPVDFEDVQADGNPLYDQAGNILYYNIWYSEPECQATAAGFVAGTFEIKAAWRILPGPDPTYYTMSATLPAAGGKTQEVTLGLVGFHLVNWTSKHPEFIWATWEHKTNAPLCDGSSPTTNWSLTSGAAAQCLASNPVSSGQISPNCTQYNFNTPGADTPSPPPPTDTPDQVCRLYANGNQSGTSINGNDNAANLLAIQQLNEQLVGPEGLLTKLPGTNAMAIWANYEMIGGIWTKGGAASGQPPVVHGGKPGDPNSPQRGSLELTNMTMETFEQGDSSPIPNCFSCHGYKPATPLSVSHIATEYLLPSVQKQVSTN